MAPAALIALLLAAQTACPADRALTPCELQIYRAAATWEGRAREGRRHNDGLTAKLATRTSTVIRELIPVDPIEVEVGHSTGTVLLITGIVTVVVGVLAYAAGAKGGGTQVVVAR